MNRIEHVINGTDFAVYVNGLRIDKQTEGLQLVGVDKRAAAEGALHNVSVYRYSDSFDVHIESHVIAYEETTLVERWVSVLNVGADSVTIGRVDSFRLALPEDSWTLMHYKSEWGAEFEPVRMELANEDVILQTRQGRSSKDMHPWMSLIGSGGDLLTVSPMWSGNWILRCEQIGVSDEGAGIVSDEGCSHFEVSGGLNDWEFAKVLQPGETMEGIHVAIAAGSGGELNSTSIPFARVGRKHWYVSNAFSRSLPAEWNHWWSYEDKTINEDVFRVNAAEAAKLGIEICTLDAGWFGPSEAASEWFEHRGDWEMVNTTRFPSGIRALSDYVHSLGMKFGLWCEIEALGKAANLSQRHPSFPARRDGEQLGYLCFGNPEVQEWAFRTLDELIAGYNCQWIKLDFNLDPQAGCSCTDHGHGAGDGLFEHYKGYYRMLDRVRAKQPEVILENCSSGGLRIDLGMLSHTHTTFLSDPDWPEHSLQVFWGATTMLAAEVCLHWSYSEFLWNYEKQQFHPNSPDLKPYQFDYYTRIAMLRGFGISQKLPQMPEWMRERLAFHIGVYQRTVKPFVRSADLYRLTGQPVRGGLGDCWSAFQYSQQGGEEHLLFVFRLPGAEATRSIRMQGLDAAAAYQLTYLSGDSQEESSVRTGEQLMTEGMLFSGLEIEESALLTINRLTVL
ncbi:alpha-galactosidase [Paenibacillus lignilyticus]|uniref:alpha-galactosidase n=1 Tax=Paenibacillus lignilyticus TaxID=1172615 RepID=A0ABS5C8U6_9BACL|nr:alpha-galactosidase [Paenibacillus lignilyticus]MBP3962426.1 alpha-galactosidase [Paenibacillus lignilyticus]